MTGEMPSLVLGGPALAVLGLYLVGMLGLGVLGRAKRREESMRDFYLAGSGFGFGRFGHVRHWAPP